jgi:hypothetical protein
MNASRDQLMADAGDENDESRLPLSQDEEKVLELYDKLRELQLEIAIINAQNAQPPGMCPLVRKQSAVVVRCDVTK